MPKTRKNKVLNPWHSANPQGRKRHKFTTTSEFLQRSWPFPNSRFCNWRHKNKNVKTQRSPSPFSGTEEHTQKKIKETSAMIKRQLMFPESPEKQEKTSKEKEVLTESTDTVEKIEKSSTRKATVKANKKPVQYNVVEIQGKIINHLTNLNHGKKLNLICADSTGYDDAIEQVQILKRLAISRALRDMLSNRNPETCHAFEAIIPDIGVKVEDLPMEILMELRHKLDINFDSIPMEPTVAGPLIKQEIADYDLANETIENVSTEPENADRSFTDNLNGFTAIKTEICDNTTDFIEQEKSESLLDDHQLTVNGSQFYVETCSTSTQTEDAFQYDLNQIGTIQEAMVEIAEIDCLMDKLNERRKTICSNLHKLRNDIETEKKSFSLPNSDFGPANESNEITKKVRIESSKGNGPKRNAKGEQHKYKNFNLDSVCEKALVMQTYKNTLLVGCESGKVLFINSQDGIIFATIPVSKVPITSIQFASLNRSLSVFVATFDTTLREFSYKTRELLKEVPIYENIQCMDSSWNYVFMGTDQGQLKRYSLKQSALEFTENISNVPILGLLARQEGARKVLVVATKYLPIMIRDAMSGLQLRTIGDPFSDGACIQSHKVDCAEGISSMRLHKNILFVGCYNGNVYVYNMKCKKYLGHIAGPGGAILSMEVTNDLVLIGTKSFKLKSMQLPEYILAEYDKDV